MYIERSSLDVVPSSPGEWYAGLDHREIDGGRRRWVTEVSGVHTDGRDWWVQVSPVGEPDHGLVLHLSGRTTLKNALDALRKHSRSAIDSPQQIVHVTRAA